jgi:ribosome-associated protein
MLGRRAKWERCRESGNQAEHRKMSAREPTTKTVSIGDRAINLTQVLKLAGCAESGGAAKALIAAGRVQVNGQVELRKRCQMKAGDTIAVEGGPTVVLAVSST